MNSKIVLMISMASFILTLAACGQNKSTVITQKVQTMQKTEEEWKKELTPEQYRILRQKGTERAFTGKFWNHFDDGKYVCAGCGTELFVSETKFESGCGWPSFYQPKDSTVIAEHRDTSWGMIRTEVVCKKCGGHLGHVFDDGPNPTGLRYCINSESLEFKKEADH